MTRKKKPIKLRVGAIETLAKDCGVSKRTVNNALAWKSDTDTQNLVRKRAYELGLVRRF